MNKDWWLRCRVTKAVKQFGPCDLKTANDIAKEAKQKFPDADAKMSEDKKAQLDRFLIDSAQQVYPRRKRQNRYLRPLIIASVVLFLELIKYILFWALPSDQGLIFLIGGYSYEGIVLLVLFVLSLFFIWSVNWLEILGSGLSFVGCIVWALELTVATFGHASYNARPSYKVYFPGILSVFLDTYKEDGVTISSTEFISTFIDFIFFFALAFFIAFLVLYLKEQSTIKNSKL